MKQKRLSLLLSATATAILCGGPAIQASAADLIEGQAEMAVLPDAWFVELKGAPAADGTSKAALMAEHAAFRSAAKKAGAKFIERRSFDTLWNGLSITASRSDIAKIGALPGVAAVWPVAIVAAPDVKAGASPELFTALSMTGADIAQSELGYTGEGVKVAVMDTGIDYHHPDLGGCFGPGCRVEVGHDFVGDAFNADPSSVAYNPTPAPDDDPDDCGGHGTHVAGIVGANGTVKGVAPDATFGAYRVFGCSGSTTADIMIAAMERALADGTHVLNMSIGSAFQWPQYPTATAADRLVNKKVVVVASIGNSGASGLYSAGAPGLGKKVIGVASFDNTVSTQNAFRIDPGNMLVGFNSASGAPVPPVGGSAPISAPSPILGCNAADFAGFPAGHVALISRGTCTFAIKSLNAMAAGASAVILFNNTAGALNPTVAGSGVTIPVVAITQAAGQAIAAIPGAIVTWGNFTVSTPLASGGLISSFSSYGLSPDLALKPDIGAPGGSIYSTYPMELGRYASLGGTSMASPHVAGAAALMLQAKPKTNSQIMRTVLQNSADPKNWWGNPALGLLDNVHRQGAGMLDIDDAILATTKVEPGKIAAGESEAGTYTETLQIENNGPSEVTYDLSSVNALLTGANTFVPSFSTSDASVAFSAASVTVPAGGSATVDATITPATAPVGGQYGGYIVLTPQGGGQVHRVPFAGYIGDYQAKPVMTGGFPFLSRLSACTLLRGNNCYAGGSYSAVPAGATFNMADAYNIPSFRVHLDHQVRLLRVELFAQDGKAWHRTYNEEYVGRNSTATSFFVYPFDGTTFAGNKTYKLPDGTYYARISVLKALGDSANPAHWETWNSPMFVIDRP